MKQEPHELEERAQEARHDSSLAPVSVTMAILAVVVAAVSLLGHRAHLKSHYWFEVKYGPGRDAPLLGVSICF